MILTLLYMATYECPKCKMSANINCGKCNAALKDASLKLESGQKVQISECPNGHGKIKSPLCCGQDMSCSIS
jgi:hypothetical protein